MSHFAKCVCSITISTILKQFFASPKNWKKSTSAICACGRRDISSFKRADLRLRRLRSLSQLEICYKIYCCRNATQLSLQTSFLTILSLRTPVLTILSLRTPVLTILWLQTPFLTILSLHTPVLTILSLQTPVLTILWLQTPVLTILSLQTPVLTILWL